MAIYHFHVKAISRGTGRSAIAAAAYRRATKMKDHTTNTSHNYGKKNHVAFSDISIPEDSPQWLKDIADNGASHKSSELLWNTVEQFEIRKDARLAREIEFALPKELSLQQNIELAKQYIEQNIVSKGMVADWSLHNNDGNPHVHVMIPTRPAVNDGFGLKNREWNSKAVLNDLRKSWADTANKFMQELGIDATIDHRSYNEQGINLIPQVHLSNGVDNMYSRNVNTDIINTYHDINSKNLQIISDNPNSLFTKITIKKSDFTYDDVADNLYKYVQKTLPVSDNQASENKKLILDPTLFAQANDSIEFLTKAKIAAILEKIEYHDAVFTADKIEQELSKYTTNYKQLARAIVEVKNSRSVISLGFGDDGKERFTTANMLAVERNIQTNVSKLQQNIFANLSDKTIDGVLSDYELLTGKKLTEEQNKAVRHIVGKESISCIVGRAGTGKSFSLAAAKAIWDDQGNQVLGVALSGIAADGLVKDANMNSRTIASFLISVDNGTVKLDSKTVIVMDEAGMTDSLSMQRVLSIAENSGSKVVLVGDPAQLQPVGPGASFRAILEKTGFAEIQTVYRQKEQWQRDATVEFSKANTGNAIQAYSDNGCVHFLDNANDAIDKLVIDWQNQRDQTNKEISKFLIVAHRNADVQIINNKIREMRVARSEIADGYKVKNTVAGVEREIKISQNDRILFLKNDKTLGVANGRFATITYVNFTESGKVIDFNVKLDGSDKEITVNPNSYQDFDYGYAATVHKTQGVTVDHSFVYGGGNLNSSLTYVAMTRHKETTALYASSEQYADLEVLKERVSRLDTKDSVLNYLDEIDDYAGRRGIETNQKTLKQIVVDSLRSVKDKLVEVFTGKQQQYSDLTLDNIVPKPVEHDNKQHAKVVAEYVETRKQFGMAFTALKPKLEQLGFSKISYEPNDFAIISKIPEYQDLTTLNDKMCELAYRVTQNIEDSRIAIQLNKVDISKLESQASKHEIKLRVTSYANAVKLDSDDKYKLAYVISKDIQAHYVSLKANNVDLNQLRSDSNKWLHEQILKNRDAAKFDSFDSAVRSYLELEIRRYNIDKELRDNPTPELTQQSQQIKLELTNHVKQFENKYHTELKVLGGHDKEITINKNGGFIETYKRCLDGVLTKNDLQAVSRQVAYHQISYLISARNKLFEADKEIRPFIEQCKVNDVKLEHTPQFATYLAAKINYDLAANKAVINFEQIERATNVYNIKPSELQKYSESLSSDQSLRMGLDYLAIKDTNSRESYQLAYTLTSDTKHYNTILRLNIDNEQVKAQSNELITAFALQKSGMSELASRSPAIEFTDIVATSNKNGFFVREEQELQGFLTEYLEARTVQAKLFTEVVHNQQNHFKESLREINLKVQQIKENFVSNDDVKKTLATKYDQSQYTLTNQPSFKGGNTIAYQRALNNKSTAEDYAALRSQLSQKVAQLNTINKSIKR